MGFFSKLFKGTGIDGKEKGKRMQKNDAFSLTGKKRDTYRLIFGYTEDVSRFNYGFVHGSRTKIRNLIVGWNEDSQTIAVVPTVRIFLAAALRSFYRQSEIISLPE